MTLGATRGASRCARRVPREHPSSWRGAPSRFPSPLRGVVRMRAAGRAWRSPTGHIGSGHGGGAGVNMEWVIVLGVVALVGGYVIAIYNRRIGLGRRVDANGRAAGRERV